jgi:hypothetical protein
MLYQLYIFSCSKIHKLFFDIKIYFSFHDHPLWYTRQVLKVFLNLGGELVVRGAGIAQSVERLATGWTAEGSEFESLEGQEFSVLHVVQTCSAVHPASYPMDTGGYFPGGKAAAVWSWPLTSIYWRGQENVDVYIHSPRRLHGIMLN